MEEKYWGPATWTLFHTLAAKLNTDSKYEIFKIINIIKEICSCLPCPTCREDATDLLYNYNKYHLINNKNMLIRWLFDFHNLINRKLNKSIYTFSELNKYNQYDIYKIFNLWYKYFNIYVTDVKLINIKNKINICKLNTRNYIIKNNHLFIN